MSTPTFITLANANQFNQTTTGAAYNSFLGPADISPGDGTAGQTFTLNAGQLYPGQVLRFTAAGIYSTTGTPNLTIGVYWGVSTSNIALAKTAATATSTNVANGVWGLNALARVLTVGTSGTVTTLGTAWGLSSTGIVTPMPATSANGNTVTIDTSLATPITLGATWSASSASNTITCYQWFIEYITEP